MRDINSRPYIRLPLKKSATVVHGNALRIDWQGLLVEENVFKSESDFFL